MKLDSPNTLTREELQEALRSSKVHVECQQCHEHEATDIHHVNSNHSDNRPENLSVLCKRCHNEIHGIDDNLTMLTLMYRQFDAIQGQRIAMANRLRAYSQLGYHAQQANEILEELKVLEAHTLKCLEGMLKHEPVWQVYLSQILGVGPTMAAALIAEIGDPGRFNTVSDLWAYCGLDVREGKGRKRRKGQKANWHQRLRMIVIGRLVPSFIRLKGRDDCFGRVLYERYKAFYTQRDGDKIKPLHIENRARRKVGKVFLACLWAAWRRIKGLVAENPYCLEYMKGHSHLVTPEDWAGESWYQIPFQVSFEIEKAMEAM